VTFMATEDRPVKVPARAKPTGKISDPGSQIEPWEGTKRLVTALDPRDNGGKSSRLMPQSGLPAFFAEQGLSRLERAHALVPSILFEVRPPTGEPGAGDPPARFGGGRDRTQSVLPTPIEDLAACMTFRAPSKESAGNHGPICNSAR
jgi:hypothetical protein